MQMVEAVAIISALNNDLIMETFFLSFDSKYWFDIKKIGFINKRLERSICNIWRMDHLILFLRRSLVSFG